MCKKFYRIGPRGFECLEVVFAIPTLVVVELVIGFGKEPAHAVHLLVPVVSVDVPQNGESQQQQEDCDGDPLHEGFPRLDASIVKDENTNQKSCKSPTKMAHKPGCVFCLGKVSENKVKTFFTAVQYSPKLYFFLFFNATLIP